MKILMKTTLAGPLGNCQAGGEIELPDDMAQSLIDGRYAERVEPAPSVAPVEIPAEPIVEMTSEHPAETTEAPANRRGRRANR